MSIIIVNDWWTTKRKEVGKMTRKKFQHSSLMQTTNIKKVILKSVVNTDKKSLENTGELLQHIGQGQKPVGIYARKSVIAFKLREGTQVGWKITLRREKAWNFLFNLINLSLPQKRIFQGFPAQSFDQQGNYNLGIDNLNIFPETTYNLTFKNQGCQVTIVFASHSLEENRYFLELLNFPFS